MPIIVPRYKSIRDYKGYFVFLAIFPIIITLIMAFESYDCLPFHRKVSIQNGFIKSSQPVRIHRKFQEIILSSNIERVNNLRLPIFAFSAPQDIRLNTTGVHGAIQITEYSNAGPLIDIKIDDKSILAEKYVQSRNLLWWWHVRFSLISWFLYGGLWALYAVGCYFENRPEVPTA